MKCRKVIIFGATSAVAQAVARLHASDGDDMVLVGRDEEKINAIENDLKVLGASNIIPVCQDLSEDENHGILVEKIWQSESPPDVIYFFYGTLPDQQACEESFRETFNSLNTNMLSVISLLTLLANLCEKIGDRTIVVVTSVAGDRGRQSNYVYGTAKGGLAIFLQGLRNRLQKSNCNVITVKPGFIDTPMTESFEKGFLWATPDKVAKDIYKAIRNKKDVVYTPKFWGLIMFIIKVVPEAIFKRLSL